MITVAETTDAELLATLNEEVQNLHVILHPEMFKPFNKEETVKTLSEFFKDPTCKAYLASEHDKPMGYAVVFIRESKENAFHYELKSLYIDQIGVLKKYRTRGVGKALLQEVEALAKELKINTIELDHWSANIIAARFFRKNGYVLWRERLVKMVE